MKKYKIKYQKNNDVLVTKIEAETIVQARYIFYLTNSTAVDILEITEVKNETIIQSN